MEVRIDNYLFDKIDQNSCRGENNLNNHSLFKFHKLYLKISSITDKISIQ